MPSEAAAAQRVAAAGLRQITQRPSRSGRRRGWLVRRMLVVADVVGLTLAFVVVGLTGTGLNRGVLIASALSLPLWIALARLSHLYDQDEERTDHSTTDELVGVVQLVSIGTWVTLVAIEVTGIADPAVTGAALLWASAIVFIALARATARTLCRHSPLYAQNTLILGAGDVGQRVARKLLRHREYGLSFVGFVDAQPKQRHQDLAGLPLLGAPGDLASIVGEHAVERVIVAFSGDADEEMLAALRTLNDLEIQIDVVPRLFELVGPSVRVDTLEGLPLVKLPPARLPRSAQLIKRSIDIACATILLILLSPLFLLIAFAIRLDSRGPALFRQVRLGKGGLPFVALKFRTMHVGVDTETHRSYIEQTMSADQATNGNGLYKLERRDAITRVGRVLRKTSLDELPQLLNVLRGEMSLVGPRPCIPYETEFFEPHHFDRFLVPAGITGLWQVTARAYATFGEALDMDVAYARGWSLGLDLRLLARTPFAVLRGRGAA